MDSLPTYLDSQNLKNIVFIYMIYFINILGIHLIYYIMFILYIKFILFGSKTYSLFWTFGFCLVITITENKKMCYKSYTSSKSS